MTTNVYDSNAGMMATDSRWSLTWLNYVCCLDDIGFEKIERHGDFLYMFAGLGKRVQEWKDWLRSKPTGSAGQPASSSKNRALHVRSFIEGKHYCLLGRLNHRDGHSLMVWLPALSCWTTNKDARRAVNTAKTVDVYYTGGTTKFFDLGTGANNLVLVPGKEVRYEDFPQIFKEKGHVMEIDGNRKVNGPPFAKKEGAFAASNDEVLSEISGRLASGELHASTPCEEMVRDWTDEEKKKFNEALGEAFGWKK